ncbi:MAG: hypothetical protein ACYDCQ_14545 [Dehalococcoidia bacterium]
MKKMQHGILVENLANNFGPMTAAEVASMTLAIEAARRLRARILLVHGAELSPSSGELINELREERATQLCGEIDESV